MQHTISQEEHPVCFFKCNAVFNNAYFVEDSRLSSSASSHSRLDLVNLEKV